MRFWIEMKCLLSTNVLNTFFIRKFIISNKLFISNQLKYFVTMHAFSAQLSALRSQHWQHRCLKIGRNIIEIIEHQCMLFPYRSIIQAEYHRGYFSNNVQMCLYASFFIRKLVGGLGFTVIFGAINFVNYCTKVAFFLDIECIFSSAFAECSPSALSALLPFRTLSYKMSVFITRLRRCS